MYVCICKAVSEKRIARAVGEGATTLKDLREKTGLGTNCGKCVPHAYQMLRDTLERRHSPAAHHEVAVQDRQGGARG
jgi:bacterioferritin-associated ferredoxin